MNCHTCGSELELRTNQKYRYVESGLDTIELKGINVYVCPKCGGEIPEIGNLKQLHLVIGLGLAEQDSKLIGKEVKFLRKEMGIQAKQFAKLLGCTASHLSMVENEKRKVSEQGDRLVRVLFHVKKQNEIKRYEKVIEGYLSSLPELIEHFPHISKQSKAEIHSIDMAGLVNPEASMVM